MIEEEHVYLCQLGFARPTIVEHKNYQGEIEKVQTVNLSIEDLVKVWRKCFFDLSNRDYFLTHETA